ncbi:hypothetical protein GCM10023168_02040 [Fodinibacter luteus]|uniref:SAF domain-containing protein n=1 Tax=Fodinibacter luteus TaxID=552064 RepID=A0ABP8JXM2_9MICO
MLRRVLSAALAATAAVLALAVVRPPPPPTVVVLVAARDLPAGRVLAPGDLREARVRVDAAQPGALASAPEAVGRRVGAGLVRGEAVTGTRLVPRGHVDGLPAGRVALHVVAADPASVDLLAPGVAARVYPATGGPPLARGAVVLSTDPAPQASGPLGGADRDVRGAVLSLTAAEADAVLGGHGAVEGPVTVSLVAAPG